MIIYVISIFLSAFLLFQIQPLIGKQILPWFGGAPAVWTTCMLFFQVVLLGGYLYAHCATTWLSRRRQAALHLTLLVLALAFLPVMARPWLKPDGPDHPVGHILMLLGLTVGFPYLLLSTTSPLLQRWYILDRPGKSPYRLYALSNAGSLLALLSYPTLVEPNLPVATQAWAWSAGFVLFAILTGTCAVRMWRDRAVPAASPVEPRDADVRLGEPRPSLLTRLLWLMLPANSSILLLATTNELCQDVAVVPFLWVLPLALYLLSFIICFDHERWYYRPVFWVVGIGSAGVAGWQLQYAALSNLGAQITLLCLMLFSLCMVSHGELTRLKPAARHLTSFYLLISLGGAVGALFVTLIAPLIFTSYTELQLGIISSCAVGMLAWWHERRGRLPAGAPQSAPAPFLACFGLLAVAVAVVLWGADKQNARRYVAVERNFYGILRVEKVGADDPIERRYVLSHGRVRHGWQYVNEPRRTQATAYFGPHSGIGLVMGHEPRPSGMRVGIIGLGVGTIAAYGRPGNVIRFYEINPAVAELAATQFSYLKDSQARCEVVLGDARLSLEREPPQGYDVLVLDAFSSDSIPAHLLTREAFELYRRHLKPNGFIAAHISNRRLDLRPVVRGAATAAGLSWVVVRSAGMVDAQYSPALWMVLAENAKSLVWLGANPGGKAAKTQVIIWTDDFNDLFRIMKWRDAPDAFRGE